jgi:hypothetical protein
VAVVWTGEAYAAREEPRSATVVSSPYPDGRAGTHKPMIDALGHCRLNAGRLRRSLPPPRRFTAVEKFAIGPAVILLSSGCRSQDQLPPGSEVNAKQQRREHLDRV